MSYRQKVDIKKLKRGGNEAEQTRPDPRSTRPADPRQTRSGAPWQTIHGDPHRATADPQSDNAGRTADQTADPPIL